MRADLFGSAMLLHGDFHAEFLFDRPVPFQDRGVHDVVRIGRRTVAVGEQRDRARVQGVVPRALRITGIDEEAAGSLSARATFRRIRRPFFLRR